MNKVPSNHFPFIRLFSFFVFRFSFFVFRFSFFVFRFSFFVFHFSFFVLRCSLFVFPDPPAYGQYCRLFMLDTVNTKSLKSYNIWKI